MFFGFVLIITVSSILLLLGGTTGLGGTQSICVALIPELVPNYEIVFDLVVRRHPRNKHPRISPRNAAVNVDPGTLNTSRKVSSTSELGGGTSTFIVTPFILFVGVLVGCVLFVGLRIVVV